MNKGELFRLLAHVPDDAEMRNGDGNGITSVDVRTIDGIKVVTLSDDDEEGD